MLIVIDAGHGMQDPGAVSSEYGFTEADCTVAIVEAITKHLDGYMWLIAPRDRYSSERARWAKAQNADILVSVHLNAGSPTARGYEIYYHHGNEEGKKLAEYVSVRYGIIGLPLRGVIDDVNWHPASSPEYTGGLGVLANFPGAGILIECLFLSNPKEAAWMADQKKIDIIGGAIAMGIRDFASEKIFPDVTNPGERDAVQFCFERGLLKGFPDGLFKPLDPITRGQMAIVLKRLVEFLGKEG